MSEEVWRKTTPIPRTRKNDWDQIAEKLKSRPGEWLRVAEQVSRGSIYYMWKRDQIRALRDPEWEFKCRVSNSSADTNKGDVWMSANKKEN